MQRHESVLHDLLGLLTTADQEHRQPQQPHVMRPEQHFQDHIPVGRRLPRPGDGKA